MPAAIAPATVGELRRWLEVTERIADRGRSLVFSRSRQRRDPVKPTPLISSQYAAAFSYALELHAKQARKGIKAIVVYPMNALANSQEQELTKFLCSGYPEGKGPVTFRRYTGQENDEEKQEIIANPPDILLTNYVMLELILTRVDERQVVRAAEGLRFLVLDLRSRGLEDNGRRRECLPEVGAAYANRTARTCPARCSTYPGVGACEGSGDNALDTPLENLV